MAGTSARLTQREKQVLELLCKGLADKEVAAKLGIKCVTVRTYVSRLQEKLGATNRTQLGQAVLHIEDDGNGPTSHVHDTTDGNRAIGQSGNRAIGQSARLAPDRTASRIAHAQPHRNRRDHVSSTSSIRVESVLVPARFWSTLVAFPP